MRKILKKKWQTLNYMYNKRWFDQITYFHFFLQCFSSHSFFSYIYSCTLFWLGTNHLLETSFLDWIVFQPNIIELPSSQQKRIKIYAKGTDSIDNSTFLVLLAILGSLQAWLFKIQFFHGDDQFFVNYKLKVVNISFILEAFL